MKLFNIPYLFLFFLFTACQKKEIYQPIQSSHADYLKKSQEYSKSREESERKYLQQWVTKQKDSLQHDFEPTSSGIWIRFITKNSFPKAKPNDFVAYTAEIRNINNQIIYTPNEFGIKKGILSKFNEIRGIESALYKMSEGETAEILLPSFTAYGLYGDENKIGSNVPLVIKLDLINVKMP